MTRQTVRVFLALVAGIALLSAAECGSKGYATDTQIPGVGQEVALVQVDGQALPRVIASNASQQTSVVGGKAILGEAIASGQYSISLLRGTDMNAMTSTVSGTVVFDWTERNVSATIDLGAGLGSHTFTFQR